MAQCAQRHKQTKIHLQRKILQKNSSFHNLQTVSSTTSEHQSPRIRIEDSYLPESISYLFQAPFPQSNNNSFSSPRPIALGRQYKDQSHLISDQISLLPCNFSPILLTFDTNFHIQLASAPQLIRTAH